MDIKWIEDFLVLAEQGSFTKAAETRFVTQPAFSRRIRSLESWLGGSLVDRSAFPTKLTEMGVELIAPMHDLLGRLYDLRARVEAQSNHENSVMLSTQHSLSVSFIPQWYSTLSAAVGGKALRVNASNLHDCIESFLSAHSDLLLCYFAPGIYKELDRDDVVSARVGTEQLIPVCVNPEIYAGGLEELANVDLVGFPIEAFFGRLIHKECLPRFAQHTRFNLVYETALTESIKAMVLQGVGMAWLPSRLVAKELEAGELKLIADFPCVDMEIILYRHLMPRKAEVSRLWSKITQNLN
ncbi:LysR family transcriptional regulator [Pseudomonas sp. 7P_10.2_Bac1]|uniref:LysR family transcriptional regulator n=1 Tax=Pseudomonas sp. 7P_10.2_Bac1 TaxID=2971614 RepID=UPI0021CA971B|nr:LysR family transcriptional regulator [Pseudomonas sp. 7P_10.2_Bac1]MCU1726792.1 LysR family transcriptional regulator [Pseudomonas sp. 7P_10.2_Bac1]